MFDPFIQIQQDYSELETAYLISQLNGTALSVSKDNQDVDLVQVAFDSIRTIISYADAAIARCQTFTFGFGSTGLIAALNSYIDGIANTYSHALLNSVGSSKGDSNSDWGRFQLGLRMLGICSTLVQKFQEVDNNTRR